jgi:hypothetical protein
VYVAMLRLEKPSIRWFQSSFLFSIIVLKLFENQRLVQECHAEKHHGYHMHA